VEHRDKFGRLIQLDDTVVYVYNNCLHVGTVKKFSPKMLSIARLANHKYSNKLGLRYPTDCVIVDAADVTMWLLSQNTSRK
jgi:hypothetical protein